MRELTIRRRALDPPDPSVLAVERLIVASEGREIPWPVLQRAFELARPRKAQVRVITIARVFGTSLGFPSFVPFFTQAGNSTAKQILRGFKITSQSRDLGSIR